MAGAFFTSCGYCIRDKRKVADARWSIQSASRRAGAIFPLDSGLPRSAIRNSTYSFHLLQAPQPDKVLDNGGWSDPQYLHQVPFWDTKSNISRALDRKLERASKNGAPGKEMISIARFLLGKSPKLRVTSPMGLLPQALSLPSIPPAQTHFSRVRCHQIRLMFDRIAKSQGGSCCIDDLKCPAVPGNNRQPWHDVVTLQKKLTARAGSNKLRSVVHHAA